MGRLVIFKGKHTVGPLNIGKDLHAPFDSIARVREEEKTLRPGRRFWSFFRDVFFPAWKSQGKPRVAGFKGLPCGTSMWRAHVNPRARSGWRKCFC